MFISIHPHRIIKLAVAQVDIPVTLIVSTSGTLMFSTKKKKKKKLVRIYYLQLRLNLIDRKHFRLFRELLTDYESLGITLFPIRFS